MANIRPVRALLHKLHDYVESLIHKYPRSYLGCVTLLALIGYAFILLFPILVLVGIVNTYDALTANNTIDWQSALTWSTAVIIATLVSYRSAQIKPSLPLGLTLAEDKAPELFTIVQKLSTYFKRTIIQHIVITGNYELDIIKTPMFTLPVWSTNTMVIGLPVLQSLSPKQFERMLARRLGQFSKRENPLTNWLYQHRSIWQQYRDIYTKQKSFSTEPLRWFFTAYAPVYATASVYAARRDELNADTYAMELFNDEEVCEMVTADTVCRWYLQNKYWPAVYKIAAIEPKLPPSPHKKMATAVRASLKGEKLAQLMDEAFKAKPQWKDPTPSLINRIENIGHDKPHMEEQNDGTAASHYLGTSMNGVIDLIDKLWLKTFLEKRKQQRQQNKKQPVPEQVTSA